MNRTSTDCELPDLESYCFNGKNALQDILQSSVFGTTAQAVASLTKFSHPSTVAQTNNQNIFRTIRRTNNNDVGKYTNYEDGKQVMLDDNRSPTNAFVWANGTSLKRYSDIQFNHIWSSSKSVVLYTNLANICVTPAFLSKLTDTDTYICAFLRYRAYDLYRGFKPDNEPIPLKPIEYDNLVWAEPLPPIHNLEDHIRRAIKTKPKDRTVKTICEVGWLFSGFNPETA